MKRFFFGVLAAAIMLTLFTQCTKKTEKATDPDSPGQTTNEVVKMEVKGNVKFEFKHNGDVVDIVKDANLSNTSGVVHQFADNEKEYSFSVEYPVSNTISDNYKLTINIDPAKVDTAEQYYKYMEFTDLKVYITYKNGKVVGLRQSIPDPVQKTVSGSMLIKKPSKLGIAINQTINP